MTRIRWVWLAATVTLLAVGCSERRRAEIIQHPRWEYQDYHRIAVVPFHAPRREAVTAARQAEDMLVDQLAGSGTFTVLTRSDLAAVMSEQDLSRLADVADPGTALPEGMLKVAQAIVVGAITDFELTDDRKAVRIPRYVVDRQGRIIRDRRGQPVIAGYDELLEFRHAARVAGNVRVIDAATGRVLLSHSVPGIENQRSRHGSPPRESPLDLALQAAREIGTDFYRKIAPQRVAVKLSSDCLLLASEYYEGDYEKLKSVPIALDEVLLVTRDLPSSCDRNDFRMAISAKDSRGYLIEHEFTWSPSLGRRGEVLPVPLPLLKEAGAEEFTAKLFAVGNERPIIERSFKLELPKRR
jgi:hypothetical protein